MSNLALGWKEPGNKLSLTIEVGYISLGLSEWRGVPVTDRSGERTEGTQLALVGLGTVS